MKKIYLAIPYSGMQESSYKQANEASVCILNKGYNVFSPITHSHHLQCNAMFLGNPNNIVDIEFSDFSITSNLKPEDDELVQN